MGVAIGVDEDEVAGPEGLDTPVLFVNRSFGTRHRTDTELVAVRGDDLCLVRVRLYVDDNVQAYLFVVPVSG